MKRSIEMSQKFDEFLEEVEQDIRHEKFEKYWQKYGKTATYVIAGVLLTTGMYSLWQNNHQAKIVAASETLISAQDNISQNKFDEGFSLLRHLSKDAPGIYQTLGRFSLATELSKDGANKNVNEAIKLYQDLAADKNVDGNLRDLAHIFKIALEIESFGSNTSKMNDLRLEIDPLTKEENPLHLLAMELKAILLLKASAKTEAAELFVKIAQDQNCPDSLKTRAQLMTTTIAATLEK
jgi:hypothetical protein